MSGGEENLLVLRALGLGDFLTGLPALRALEAAFPQHRRLLAAPEWLRPVVEAAEWTLVAFQTSDEGGLPVENIRVAVNLHGKGPMSHRLLMPLRPHNFWAFRNKEIPESACFPIHREPEHEVLRWCRLLDEFGIPADPRRLELEVPGEPANEAAGATLIHPGAASPARCWPPERWAEIAEARAKRGDRVLLTGSADERRLCEQVREGAGLGPEANLAGRTGLLPLARLVKAAGLALSGDTGFAHLATAVGTPSVVLFGPVSPEVWGPPEDRPQHRAIWKGRRGNPHSRRPDPGLLQIQTSEVLSAIDEVLKAGVAVT